jgi:hypothetical protein
MSTDKVMAFAAAAIYVLALGCGSEKQQRPQAGLERASGRAARLPASTHVDRAARGPNPGGRMRSPAVGACADGFPYSAMSDCSDALRRRTALV